MAQLDLSEDTCLYVKYPIAVTYLVEVKDENDTVLFQQFAGTDYDDALYSLSMLEHEPVEGETYELVQFTLQ